ncbi:MAG: hypothetical protein ABFR75_13160 [Acidobacteriota bacterium]
MGVKKDSQDHLDVIDVFEILWKKKLIILLPALFAVLLVFLYFKVVPQDKILVLEIDTVDILKIENEEGRKFFSIRDFNALDKNEEFNLEIKRRTGSRNILLERQFIDSFTAEKIIKLNESPSEIISAWFYGIEELMFEQFESKQKLIYFEDLTRVYQNKLNLKELLKKIEIVKNHSVNNSEMFITKNPMGQEFLPPFQQLNGYRINRDTIRSNIVRLSRINLLTNKLLEIIENKKIETFRELLNLSGIEDYKEIYNKYESIPDKIDLFIEKYVNEYEIRDKAEGWIKFTLLTLIFMLFLLSFIVLLHRLYKFRSETD